MKSTLCTWEDETSNREVQFSIDYSTGNGAVEIRNVTPKKVSFICPNSNSVLRSVGVHTGRGQEMLSDQFRLSNAFEHLKALIGNCGAEVPATHIALSSSACSA